MVELQGPLSFSDTLDMLIRAAAEIEKRVEEEKNSEGKFVSVALSILWSK